MPCPVTQNLTLEVTCPGPSGAGVQEEEEVVRGLPLNTLPASSQGATGRLVCSYVVQLGGCPAPTLSY